MSRSTIRNQLLISDGSGAKLAIGTGSWVSQAINVDEHRRLSITIGIGSATGAANDAGGFTGTLQVQGTDELAQCYGGTGTQEFGAGSRPGINGWTGARFWNTIPSGNVPINNTINQMLLSFTDVGPAFVRLVFNQSATGSIATGTLGGSGTWNVYLTAKNT